MAASAAKKQAKRTSAAERQKRYRLRLLKQENPQEAEALEKAEAAKVVELQQQQQQASQEADREAASKEAAEKELDSQLSVALAGTCQMLVAAYNKGSGAPEGTPGLPSEQANAIAALWTPVLAPLLRAHAKSMLPLIAATGTIGILADYGEKRSAYIKQHKRQNDIVMEPVK